MSAPSKARWRELIDRHLVGSISLDESRELESMLANSREARADFRRRCNVDAALRQQASSPSKAAEVTLQKANRTWFPVALLASLAVIAMLAGAWIFRAPREGTANGVAVLARSAGAEWEGEPTDAGAVLPPKTLHLKSGAVLVEFYSGARVVVEGPAQFQLVSASEAFLHSGKINAHVPAQARGFTVASSGMKVVDHGTDFGIEVLNNAAPEVHVFTGNVEVAANGKTSQALNAGEALRLYEGTLKAIPAQRSTFMMEEELIRRDTADALKRFAAWREASRALSADPAMVIHYRFDEASSDERLLINQTPNAQSETNGNIVGSSWTEGRWPGKRALAFRREGDRVRIMAPQPQHAVTFLAWVHVESLPRALNTIVSSDAETTGSLGWQLTNAGQLRLSIARDLGRKHADWEAVNSEPFITPDKLGQWLLLATTFDGSTVRHYGNGRLIGTGTSFTPPALLIGAADVANSSSPVLRQLSADMDEFAILSRVMSADELHTLYQADRP